MSDRRKFDIHALYPADYCFDWKSFETDPEHYKFTEEDLAYFNAIELEKYERVTPMTPYEKRALRRWVVSGHSVMEAPPSRYGCVYPSCPAPDFLEVYRTDRELDIATKGMSKEQRIAYVKDYFGYTDETEQERQEKEEKELLYSQTPEKAKETIRMLQRQLHYAWMFMAQEGISEEAESYIKEHMDRPAPFEDEWDIF
jgi:hypothetical protein